MSDVLVHGPWGDRPVTQHIGEGTSRWWERLDNGQLAVWCRHEAHRGIRVAPVPLAPLTEPLPDRSPNRDRITLALDLHGFYGPEVDEALGVADALDTVVDGWEDGTVIPSHDDIRRLATLTGFLPHYFYAGTLPSTGWSIICSRIGGGS